jgi:1-deoxy-D-xylulose-5-phosphate reductoisomerase
MKKVVILGSTGSIGESALRVVEALPDEMMIVGLAAESNVERLLEQAERHKVTNLAVADVDAADECTRRAKKGVSVLGGPQGVAEIAAHGEADIVLCAVVGMSGLEPVMRALQAGTNVALATKEVLVVAGEAVTRAAADNGVRLLPVDSEHNAIFQCVDGKPRESVRRIILTASGGPFIGDKVDFDKVRVEEALSHPRWNMGRKVTIDSATLMNKGLEIMEAHWLFDMPVDAIDVVIHPESIIHSLVEFVDGAMLAQLSPPDMRFAIQHALTYPERMDGGLEALDLVETGSLNFMAPDENRFPCLRLARHAAKAGGTVPAVLSAANEVAVQRFLDGEIPFSGIWHTIEEVLDKHSAVASPSVEEVIDADAWARKTAGES